MAATQQGFIVKHTFLEATEGPEFASLKEHETCARHRSRSDFLVGYETSCGFGDASNVSTTDAASDNGCDVDSAPASSSDDEAPCASLTVPCVGTPLQTFSNGYVVTLDDEGFPIMIPAATTTAPFAPMTMMAPPGVMTQPVCFVPQVCAAPTSPHRPAAVSQLAQQRTCRVAPAGPSGGDDDVRTTLILRNLPNSYSRDGLVGLLDAEGFRMDYSFVYLPTDFKRDAGFGYAFVNFAEPAAARRAKQHFQGFNRWGFPSRKVCEACWSDPVQGLQAHVDRYRNSPIMHVSVPEKYRPAVYVKGVQVAFPAPTKALQAPKQRPSDARRGRDALR